MALSFKQLQNNNVPYMDYHENIFLSSRKILVTSFLYVRSIKNLIKFLSVRSREEKLVGIV